jgi:hypothetical protein
MKRSGTPWLTTSAYTPRNCSPIFVLMSGPSLAADSCSRVGLHVFIVNIIRAIGPGSRVTRQTHDVRSIEWFQ